MSRIGKKPVSISAGVKVSVSGRTINVEGPKGKLSWTCHSKISMKLDDATKTVIVARDGEDRLAKSLHGLSRTLVANMIQGCLEGYSRSLEVFGVGFGVQLTGNKFSMNLGYSHPVVFELPAGVFVDITTPQARGDSEPARFTVRSADKQAVGEFAARVRRAYPPEPYKGKGVRYVGEHVRRKVGKAFAGTGGA